MSKLDDRRDAIRDIVRNEQVKTQRELADKLRERGFECTQATISRDIADMGLEKGEGGVYMLSEDKRFRRVVNELVTSAEAAMNVVVVKTMPGSASAVGEVLDTGNIEGLLGCVAGDNTVMIVAKDPLHAERIVHMINLG